MQKTRQKILLYLQDYSWVAASDLARALEMTPANIRYHLQILLEEGQIQISGQRSAGGSGRPIYLYNLSSRVLGQNLQDLLAAFLEDLEDRPDPESAAQELAARLIDFDLDPNLKPVPRYNLAVEFLNNHSYNASWDARLEGPRVELRHCPYQELALTHPQICRIDQELISKLFNTPLILAQKRSFSNNPYSPCIFSAGSS